MHQLISSTLKKFGSLIKKDIFKSLSVYTILGFVQKAFPILLLPFLTRVLTPADYGIIAMFATVKAFFGPFLGLGSASSIERYYFDKKEINFPIYLSNILIIIFTTTIFFGAIFLLLGDHIHTLTQIPKSFLWIVIVVSFSSLINKINLVLYRVQNKSMSFAYLKLFETGLYFLLMMLLVFSFKFDWRADFYSQLIIYTLLAIWGYNILKKNKLLDFKFNSSYSKSALTFGLPMFIHTFGLFFVNMTDKLFITHFVGIEGTGIYNIGFKMATIVVFFVTAFNNAYVPWLYGKLKEKTIMSFRKAIKSTAYSFLAVGTIGLILFILLPFIYPLFFVGEKFLSSLTISRLIVVGEIFNAFYLLLVSYIIFEKATKYVMYITLITSVISVGLNYFLIPYFGVIGAAYTLLGVYFIKFALTLLFVYIIYQKHYKLLRQ